MFVSIYISVSTYISVCLYLYFCLTLFSTYISVREHYLLSVRLFSTYISVCEHCLLSVRLCLYLYFCLRTLSIVCPTLSLPIFLSANIVYCLSDFVSTSISVCEHCLLSVRLCLYLYFCLRTLSIVCLTLSLPIFLSANIVYCLSDFVSTYISVCEHCLLSV